jgi:hypothetical protein
VPKQSAPKKTAPKQAPKKSLSAGAEADPRFELVAAALARVPGFSLMESKSGALRGMMLHGKSFGMSSHGRFILKLNDERAAALIAQGVGKAFSPSPGRAMKGWLEVTKPKADWVALAKEGLALAAAPKKPSPRAAKKKSAAKIGKPAKRQRGLQRSKA